MTRFEREEYRDRLLAASSVEEVEAIVAELEPRGDDDAFAVGVREMASEMIGHLRGLDESADPDAR